MPSNSKNTDSILDLLVDPSDAADLLQTLDLPEDYVTDPPIPALRALLAGRDSSRIVSALISFAAKFARMTDAIANFFKRHRIGPNAQLHIKSVGVNLSFDSFQASWATNLESMWPEAAQERSESIATAVSSLVEYLRFEDFVYFDREVLQKRLDHQGASKQRRGTLKFKEAKRRGITEFCADGDYNAVKFANIMVEEVLHDLSRQ